MRRFLIKLLVILVIPILFIGFSFLFWLNGYIDPYYMRISSPRQSSMILGTSRSSLGLVPSVFEKNGYNNVFNYSFTIADSPWGEDYYNSICKKLDTTSNNGLFVLTVDPFSISARVSDDGEEIIPSTRLSEINDVTSSPNYEYIYKMDVKPWRYLLVLLHIESKTFCLHEDGWYENLRLYDKETEKVETKLKLKGYKSEFAKSKLSDHRMGYLKNTIQKLKQYGRVVLVRVPTSTDMYEYECEYMPSFDSLMNDLSVKYCVKYYNFGQESGTYRTFDGNHLIPEEAKWFTQRLCDSLRN
ncbi:MAG: hypothetical protein IK025_08525 [Bacteroidales bacterium]|nr:hypothetical protein [Bacteroidales bacterium]